MPRPARHAKLVTRTPGKAPRLTAREREEGRALLARLDAGEPPPRGSVTLAQAQAHLAQLGRRRPR